MLHIVSIGGNWRVIVGVPAFLGFTCGNELHYLSHYSSTPATSQFVKLCTKYDQTEILCAFVVTFTVSHSFRLRRTSDTIKRPIMCYQARCRAELVEHDTGSKSAFSDMCVIADQSVTSMNGNQRLYI